MPMRLPLWKSRAIDRRLRARRQHPLPFLGVFGGPLFRRFLHLLGALSLLLPGLLIGALRRLPPPALGHKLLGGPFGLLVFLLGDVLRGFPSDPLAGQLLVRLFDLLPGCVRVALCGLLLGVALLGDLLVDIARSLVGFA